MPAKQQPTNSDIIRKLDDMNATLQNTVKDVSVLKNWRIADDAAKKAVSEYRLGEREANKDKETSEWIKVAKQVGIVLGIVIAILYAYASTKGLHL